MLFAYTLEREYKHHIFIHQKRSRILFIFEFSFSDKVSAEYFVFVFFVPPLNYPLIFHPWKEEELRINLNYSWEV